MQQPRDWTRRNQAALVFVALVGTTLIVLVVVWGIPLARAILGINQIYKAPWSLAHSITPDATSVDLVVSDPWCGAEGSSSGGRMLSPTVVYAPASITITVELVSDGDGSCLGHGQYPVTVMLTEPVGNRELLGGVPTEPLIRSRPLL